MEIKLIFIAVLISRLGGVPGFFISKEKVQPDHYEVKEDKTTHSVTITSPKHETPTLREITYYHIIEKPYDQVTNLNNNRHRTISTINPSNNRNLANDNVYFKQKTNLINTNNIKDDEYVLFKDENNIKNVVLKSNNGVINTVNVVKTADESKNVNKEKDLNSSSHEKSKTIQNNAVRSDNSDKKVFEIENVSNIVSNNNIAQSKAHTNHEISKNNKKLNENLTLYVFRKYDSKMIQDNKTRSDNRYNNLFQNKNTSYGLTFQNIAQSVVNNNHDKNIESGTEYGNNSSLTLNYSSENNRKNMQDNTDKSNNNVLETANTLNLATKKNVTQFVIHSDPGIIRESQTAHTNHSTQTWNKVTVNNSILIQENTARSENSYDKIFVNEITSDKVNNKNISLSGIHNNPSSSSRNKTVYEYYSTEKLDDIRKNDSQIIHSARSNNSYNKNSTQDLDNVRKDFSKIIQGNTAISEHSNNKIFGTNITSNIVTNKNITQLDVHTNYDNKNSKNITAYKNDSTQKLEDFKKNYSQIVQGNTGRSNNSYKNVFETENTFNVATSQNIAQSVIRSDHEINRENQTAFTNHSTQTLDKVRVNDSTLIQENTAKSANSHTKISRNEITSDTVTNKNIVQSDVHIKYDLNWKKLKDFRKNDSQIIQNNIAQSDNSYSNIFGTEYALNKVTNNNIAQSVSYSDHEIIIESQIAQTNHSAQILDNVTENNRKMIQEYTVRSENSHNKLFGNEITSNVVTNKNIAQLDVHTNREKSSKNKTVSENYFTQNLDDFRKNDRQLIQSNTEKSDNSYNNVFKTKNNLNVVTNKNIEQSVIRSDHEINRESQKTHTNYSKQTSDNVRENYSKMIQENTSTSENSYDKIFGNEITSHINTDKNISQSDVHTNHDISSKTKTVYEYYSTEKLDDSRKNDRQIIQNNTARSNNSYNNYSTQVLDNVREDFSKIIQGNTATSEESYNEIFGTEITSNIVINTNFSQLDVHTNHDNIYSKNKTVYENYSTQKLDDFKKTDSQIIHSNTTRSNNSSNNVFETENTLNVLKNKNIEQSVIGSDHEISRESQIEHTNYSTQTLDNVSENYNKMIQENTSRSENSFDKILGNEITSHINTNKNISQSGVQSSHDISSKKKTVFEYYPIQKLNYFRKNESQNIQNNITRSNNSYNNDSTQILDNVREDFSKTIQGNTATSEHNYNKIFGTEVTSNIVTNTNISQLDVHTNYDNLSSKNKTVYENNSTQILDDSRKNNSRIIQDNKERSDNSYNKVSETKNTSNVVTNKNIALSVIRSDHKISRDSQVAYGNHSTQTLDYTRKNGSKIIQIDTEMRPDNGYNKILENENTSYSVTAKNIAQPTFHTNYEISRNIKTVYGNNSSQKPDNLRKNYTEIIKYYTTKTDKNFFKTKNTPDLLTTKEIAQSEIHNDLEIGTKSQIASGNYSTQNLNDVRKNDSKMIQDSTARSNKSYKKTVVIENTPDIFTNKNIAKSGTHINYEISGKSETVYGNDSSQTSNRIKEYPNDVSNYEYITEVIYRTDTDKIIDLIQRDVKITHSKVDKDISNANFSMLNNNAVFHKENIHNNSIKNSAINYKYNKTDTYKLNNITKDFMILVPETFTENVNMIETDFGAENEPPGFEEKYKSDAKNDFIIIVPDISYKNNTSDIPMKETYKYTPNNEVPNNLSEGLNIYAAKKYFKDIDINESRHKNNSKYMIDTPENKQINARDSFVIIVAENLPNNLNTVSLTEHTIKSTHHASVTKNEPMYITKKNKNISKNNSTEMKNKSDVFEIQEKNKTDNLEIIVTDKISDKLENNKINDMIDNESNIDKAENNQSNVTKDFVIVYFENSSKSLDSSIKKNNTLDNILQDSKIENKDDKRNKITIEKTQYKSSKSNDGLSNKGQSENKNYTKITDNVNLTLTGNENILLTTRNQTTYKVLVFGKPKVYSAGESFQTNENSNFTDVKHNNLNSNLSNIETSDEVIIKNKSKKTLNKNSTIDSGFITFDNNNLDTTKEYIDYIDDVGSGIMVKPTAKMNVGDDINGDKTDKSELVLYVFNNYENPYDGKEGVDIKIRYFTNGHGYQYFYPNPDDQEIIEDSTNTTSVYNELEDLNLPETVEIRNGNIRTDTNKSDNIKESGANKAATRIKRFTDAPIDVRDGNDNQSNSPQRKKRAFRTLVPVNEEIAPEDLFKDVMDKISERWKRSLKSDGDSYGMSLTGDKGVVWNNFNEEKVSFPVGINGDNVEIIKNASENSLTTQEEVDENSFNEIKNSDLVTESLVHVTDKPRFEELNILKTNAVQYEPSEWYIRTNEEIYKSENDVNDVYDNERDAKIEQSLKFPIVAAKKDKSDEPGTFGMYGMNLIGGRGKVLNDLENRKLSYTVGETTMNQGDSTASFSKDDKLINDKIESFKNFLNGQPSKLEQRDEKIQPVLSTTEKSIRKITTTKNRTTKELSTEKPIVKQQTTKLPRVTKPQKVEPLKNEPKDESPKNLISKPDTESKELKAKELVKTYGMSISGDSGIVWNDLNGGRTVHHVGDEKNEFIMKQKSETKTDDDMINEKIKRFQESLNEKSPNSQTESKSNNEKPTTVKPVVIEPLKEEPIISEPATDEPKTNRPIVIGPTTVRNNEITTEVPDTGMTDKPVKTYGMSLTGDTGLVWNDLNGDRISYHVGESLETSKEEQINTSAESMENKDDADKLLDEIDAVLDEIEDVIEEMAEETENSNDDTEKSISKEILDIIKEVFANETAKLEEKFNQLNNLLNNSNAQKDNVNDKDENSKTEIDVQTLVNNDEFRKWLNDWISSYTDDVMDRVDEHIKEEVAKQIEEYLATNKDETASLNSSSDEDDEIDKNNNKEDTDEDLSKKRKDCDNKKENKESAAKIHATNVYGNSVGNGNVTNIFIYNINKVSDIDNYTMKPLVNGTGGVFVIGNEQEPEKDIDNVELEGFDEKNDTKDTTTETEATIPDKDKLIDETTDSPNSVTETENYSKEINDSNNTDEIVTNQSEENEIAENSKEGADNVSMEILTNSGQDENSNEKINSKESNDDKNNINESENNEKEDSKEEDDSNYSNSNSLEDDKEGNTSAEKESLESDLEEYKSESKESSGQENTYKSSENKESKEITDDNVGENKINSSEEINEDTTSENLEDAETENEVIDSYEIAEKVSSKSEEE